MRRTNGVLGAINTLRMHGYDTSKLSRRVSRFKPKRNDIAKFKRWLLWAAKTHGRFVVAVRGRDRHSVTFHTLSGYEGRRKHAASLGGGKNVQA